MNKQLQSLFISTLTSIGQKQVLRRNSQCDVSNRRPSLCKGCSELPHLLSNFLHPEQTHTSQTTLHTMPTTLACAQLPFLVVSPLIFRGNLIEEEKGRRMGRGEVVLGTYTIYVILQYKVILKKLPKLGFSK